jgi:selenophosphate synthase
MNNEHKLTKFVQAAGCAAKMGPGDLKQALCNLNQKNEQILVGFDTSDDAGIFQIDENLALVQTVDFITPVVDDPYIYGQIAAANSLSDIFAMGGEVKTALNIVGFDSTNVSKEALGEILRGGLEKIKECGGSLLGGHTIQTPEMYYGLSVTGIIHPKDVKRNNSAKVGDVIVLTKPIGMGYEGTVIYNQHHMYKYNERSSDAFKYKKALDAEFLIVGYELDRQGNPTIVCRSEGGDFKVRPTGTSEYRKQLLLDMPNNIGKFYKVEYETLSKDKIPLKPVGICIRDCDQNGQPLE